MRELIKQIRQYTGLSQTEMAKKSAFGLPQ